MLFSLVVVDRPLAVGHSRAQLGNIAPLQPHPVQNTPLFVVANVILFFLLSSLTPSFLIKLFPTTLLNLCNSS
jgi:hypothetical protein